MARVIELQPKTTASLSDSTRRWLILAVVSAAQFMCVLDLWVVNIALPTLQRDFAPVTLSDVVWTLNVYMILLATLLVPAGRLADSRGRRALFLAGLALFGVASLGCALAPLLRTSAVRPSGCGRPSAPSLPEADRYSADCLSTRAGGGSSSSTCRSSSGPWQQVACCCHGTVRGSSSGSTSWARYWCSGRRRWCARA